MKITADFTAENQMLFFLFVLYNFPMVFISFLN